MNIKAVVKVMNFHSLLRVESSRRQAEKFSSVEDSLMMMMSMILNNKNLKLDRKIKEPNKNAPLLKIYIGSDYGFCGSVNAGVSSILSNDNNDSSKIIIGKKIKGKVNNELLKITLEDFQNDFNQVKKYLEQEIKKGTWSAIDVIYNHFYNLSNVKLETKRIYPIENIKDNTKNNWDDFILEGDANDMFEDMLILFLSLELKIAAVSAYASENIMRQNSTTESLKRIDEKEEEDIKLRNKIKTQISVTKTIDNFIKQKHLQKN